MVACCHLQPLSRNGAQSFLPSASGAHGVLASWSCPNKLPQTGGLQQGVNQPPCPSPNAWAGDQKSQIKVSQGHAPPRGSGGKSFLPLPAPGGSRCPSAYSYITPISGSMLTFPPLCVHTPSAFLLSKDM